MIRVLNGLKKYEKKLNKIKGTSTGSLHNLCVNSTWMKRKNNYSVYVITNKLDSTKKVSSIYNNSECAEHTTLSYTSLKIICITVTNL